MKVIADIGQRKNLHAVLRSELAHDFLDRSGVARTLKRPCADGLRRAKNKVHRVSGVERAWARAALAGLEKASTVRLVLRS